MKRFVAVIVILFLYIGMLSIALETAEVLPEKQSVPTIKKFLETAIEPIGSTMYIWGGGWNETDTAAGSGALRIGVSPKWKRFADKQTSSYDYRDYRYKIEHGLDCSGYVGWTIYNTVKNPAPKGYVANASNQAIYLAKQGFGMYRSRNEVMDYCAGDIMSSECTCCGHVWIVIGECVDGSVVLVHSSPPGVRICGTVNPEGDVNSQAVNLAKQYMKQYYPDWYHRYSSCAVDSAYLSHYGQMRWRLDENIMSDPEGLCDMKAKKILKIILK